MNPYFAPAKVNLFLHVVGRRDDGYHLLESVFQLLDFGDSLDINATGDGVIRRVGTVAGVVEADDLAIRAARALKLASGSRQGAEIGLAKRIPMGGGLGGGSSDAATVLLVLNRLWGLSYKRAQLAEIGLKLGADVPFFLFGRAAYASGIGEQLAEVALPERWFVVLQPQAQVPTGEIFRAPELTRNTKSVKMADFSTDGWSFPRSRYANDLEAVAGARFPAVAGAVLWLKSHDGAAQVTARMTGSGACVFAAFGSAVEANRVFAGRPAEVGGFVAKSLARHPLADYAPD